MNLNLYFSKTSRLWNPKTLIVSLDRFVYLELVAFLEMNAFLDVANRVRTTYVPGLNIAYVQFCPSAQCNLRGNCHQTDLTNIVTLYTFASFSNKVKEGFSTHKSSLCVNICHSYIILICRVGDADDANDIYS